MNCCLFELIKNRLGKHEYKIYLAITVQDDQKVTQQEKEAGKVYGGQYTSLAPLNNITRVLPACPGEGRASEGSPYRRRGWGSGWLGWAQGSGSGRHWRSSWRSCRTYWSHARAVACWNRTLVSSITGNVIKGLIIIGWFAVKSNLRFLIVKSKISALYW